MSQSRTSHDRRSERSRRLAAERAAQAHKERRKKAALVTAVVAGVLAVVVGLGVAVQSSRNSTDTQGPVPAGAEGGSFLQGEAAAPVTVTLYEDFLCPACAAAEEALAPTLDALVEDGTVRIDHRPIAFLDRASTDRYSTRALNAAACVIDAAPDSYPAFHAAMFDEQPAENGPGLSDARLAEIADGAGAPGLSSCMADLRFESWTKTVTDQASKDGVNQTPTILVDGAPLQERTAAGLRAAVDAAA